MHVVWFDKSGIVFATASFYVHYVQYYKIIKQDKLRPAMKKKRPGLLQSAVIFHHDKAPAHTARIVTELLDEYEWPVLEHPHYSPDVAPYDFWLFPKMKEQLRVTDLNQRKTLFSRRWKLSGS
ncbi:mariner mos1 transposase [Plakobranchus ocellatus]|uniref:Mariner mos1 transposase n=1 Tax=Plakobranchus ocellatus TaxID=259542 RepID=A0AAV4DD87_9GAST|nr:mariner mos1 transposase [Plakobranchus ocellatus]